MATTAADAVTTLTPPPAAGFPGHARPRGWRRVVASPHAHHREPQTREPRRERRQWERERARRSCAPRSRSRSASRLAWLPTDDALKRSVRRSRRGGQPFSWWRVVGRVTTPRSTRATSLSTPSASPSPSRRPASSRSTELRAPHRRVRCSHSVSLAPAPT